MLFTNSKKFSEKEGLIYKIKECFRESKGEQVVAFG